MREFFKGWRRKAGCVTLMMACVLTAVWIRSLFVTEAITYRSGENTLHTLQSSAIGLILRPRAFSGTGNVSSAAGKRSSTSAVIRHLDQLTAKAQELGMGY